MSFLGRRLRVDVRGKGRRRSSRPTPISNRSTHFCGEALEDRRLLAVDGYEIIADYADDYSRNAPLTDGWQYLWNAPDNWISKGGKGDLDTGRLGETSSYLPLEDAGNFWTADGDRANNSMPDRSLRLKPNGGRPGLPAGKAGNGVDRFVIAAYTVDSDGFYAIADSFLSKRSSKGDGIDLVVHVNDYRPVFVSSAGAGLDEAIDFDVEIGFLQAGDTIYVAFGPGDSPTSDNFEADFSIARAAGRSIQQQIDDAIAAGESSVTIDPGTYFIHPENERGAHIEIRRQDDFEIDAAGVALIAGGGGAGLKIVKSDHVTVRGLSIDYDPLPFTQGTIVDQAGDGSWAIVEIDAGYPMPNDPHANRILIHDPSTGLLKAETLPRTAADIVWLEGDRYQVAFDRSYNDPVSVGDRITLRQDGMVPFSVQLADATDVVLDGVTVYSGSNVGIDSQGGSGHQFVDVRIIPGPTPLLATQPRLRSINGTGIRSINESVGPRIERARIESTADDGVNIHGEFGLVIQPTSSNQLAIAMKDELIYEAGDRIRILRAEDHVIEERVVVAVEPLPIAASQLALIRDMHLPELRLNGRYEEAHLVTLDAPVSVSQGDLTASPDRDGSGFAVVDSVITNTPAVGIRAKGSHGVVESNLIEQTFRPAILVAAEPENWGESAYAENLTITNNTIIAANVGNGLSYQFLAGAITISSDDPDWNANGHRNILIQNNRFERVAGVNLQITNATNVMVEGNFFVDTHQTPLGHGDGAGVDSSAIVWLDRVDGVHFSDNLAQNIGPHGNVDAMIVATETAINVTGTISLAPTLPDIEVAPPAEPALQLDLTALESAFADLGDDEDDE
ncbi:MAG: right-handed parallel beta-helix repeat-containing protein [Planctomycetales bacterium]|nr:right-handed parallel beta-helix repeat-containing protein [Planctomycetales bacterium]